MNLVKISVKPSMKWMTMKKKLRKLRKKARRNAKYGKPLCDKEFPIYLMLTPTSQRPAAKAKATKPASKSASKPASKKAKPSSSRAKKSKAVSEDDEDED